MSSTAPDTGAPARVESRGAGDSLGDSLREYGRLARKHRRLLLGLPLMAMIGAIAVSLVLPKRFTVESRFMPESTGPDVSRLAGMAAQFGFELPSGESGESVDFYAELLESHDLLRSVVLTEFRVPRPGRDTVAGNLVTLLDVGGKTPAEQVRNAVDRLADLVVVRPDPGAKMVTVRTSAPWPALAVQINQRLLALLNEFNLERRQSRAAAERAFLESRVDEAEADLTEAEGALERFLTENRRYRESPQLMFEYGRLDRRVELRQQVYTSLAQGYEQARVDEVRNTPVITVIDEPRAPARQTAPRLLTNALLGLVLGGLIALSIVLVRELLGESSWSRRRPETVRQN